MKNGSILDHASDRESGPVLASAVQRTAARPAPDADTLLLFSLNSLPDKIAKRFESHLEAVPFEHRFILVSLLDAKQTSANREQVQILRADDPLRTDSLFGLAPEPSPLVRRHAPAPLDGKRKTRGFAACRYGR